MRESVPQFKIPAARMVLPIWNHYRFDAIFVDDQGSCTNQHILSYGRHHRYQDEKGRLFVVLCPERLTYDERTACVSDVPAGTWESKIAHRKVDKIASEAQKRAQRLREETIGYR